MSEPDGELYGRYGIDFPVGTVLFHEGEPGQEMYVVHAGRIRLTRGTGGRETVLAELPAGEFFGEMAIVTSEPRSATATVVEAARLLVIDSVTFDSMVRGNAEIALRIIRQLAGRLQAANQQIDILLSTEPHHRVAFALRMEADRSGLPMGPGIKIPWDTSTLANKVGLSVEEVSLVLEQLAQAALVTPLSDGFLIPQIGELQNYLQYLEYRKKSGEHDALS